MSSSSQATSSRLRSGAARTTACCAGRPGSSVSINCEKLSRAASKMPAGVAAFSSISTSPTCSPSLHLEVGPLCPIRMRHPRGAGRAHVASRARSRYSVDDEGELQVDPVCDHGAVPNDDLLTFDPRSTDVFDGLARLLDPAPNSVFEALRRLGRQLDDLADCRLRLPLLREHGHANSFPRDYPSFHRVFSRSIGSFAERRAQNYGSRRDAPGFRALRVLAC